jgi:hypothetical protein
MKANKIADPISETTIDPRQPSREEKKANIASLVFKPILPDRSRSV